MIEIAAVIAITIALFGVLQELALAERGYEAIGGEYGAFLFPAFWLWGKEIARDIKDRGFFSKEDDYEN